MGTFLYEIISSTYLIIFVLIRISFASWHDKCLNAKCDVAFQFKCPDDSILIQKRSAEDKTECCEKPGRCVCNFKYCEENQLLCSSGYKLITITKSTRTPGNCCDVQKCLAPKLDCSSTVCSSIDHADNCPDDSYRPNNVTNSQEALDSFRHCCPFVEPCICKSDYCKPAWCPDKQRLKILKRGLGLPGTCCDEFECLDEPPKSMQCEHNRFLYEDNSLWQPDPCTECHCKGGVSVCKKFRCPETDQCSSVTIPDGECCPICTGCKTEKNEIYNFTDSWQKDECTFCSCGQNGAILCHQQLCSIDCDRPTKIVGRCCPVCEIASVIKIPFVCPSVEHCPLLCDNGYKRDSQGCFVCECDVSLSENSDVISIDHDSKEIDNAHRHAGSLCSKLDYDLCNKKCAHGYETDINNCSTCKCKICPKSVHCLKNCLYGFETDNNKCRICKCRGFSLVADSNGRKTINNQLKPCHSSNLIKDHGEWWFDGCRYCYCDSGQEFCSLLSCSDDALCKNNATVHYDNCCPSCSKTLSPKVSASNNLACHAPGTGRSFIEGEVWWMDKCIQCTCHIGHVLCHRKVCGPVACENPINLPGHCCSTCQDSDLNHFRSSASDYSNRRTTSNSHCTIDNRSYSSGSHWKEGACKSCRCNNGSVVCFEEICDQLGSSSTCSIGERKLFAKDVCCPICASQALAKSTCQYKKIRYSIGEHWRDGPCRNCTCEKMGEILCTQYECPKACPLNRLHDSRPIDECCSLCSHNDSTVFDSTFNTKTSNQNDVTFSIILAALCISIALLIFFISLFVLSHCRRSDGIRRRKIDVSHHPSLRHRFSSATTSSLAATTFSPSTNSSSSLEYPSATTTTTTTTTMTPNIPVVQQRIDECNDDDAVHDPLLIKIRDTQTFNKNNLYSKFDGRLPSIDAFVDSKSR